MNGVGILVCVWLVEIAVFGLIWLAFGVVLLCIVSGIWLQQVLYCVSTRFFFHSFWDLWYRSYEGGHSVFAVEFTVWCKV